VKVRYSVTFEFLTLPPATHRGIVDGSSPATCAARAAREARKALRPRNWASLVVCLLERLDAAGEAEAPDAEEAAEEGVAAG
jgi:hypothetical protein